MCSYMKGRARLLEATVNTPHQCIRNLDPSRATWHSNQD
jgi:hypothetical protein